MRPALGAILADVVPAQQSVVTALHEPLHDSLMHREQEYRRDAHRRRDLRQAARRANSPYPERFRQIERAEDPKRGERPELKWGGQSDEFAEVEVDRVADDQAAAEECGGGGGEVAAHELLKREVAHRVVIFVGEMRIGGSRHQHDRGRQRAYRAQQVVAGGGKKSERQNHEGNRGDNLPRTGRGAASPRYDRFAVRSVEQEQHDERIDCDDEFGAPSLQPREITHADDRQQQYRVAEKQSALRIEQHVPENADLRIGQTDESDRLLGKLTIFGGRKFERLVAEEERISEGAPVVSEHDCDGDRGAGGKRRQTLPIGQFEQGVDSNRRGDQEDRVIVKHGPSRQKAGRKRARRGWENLERRQQIERGENAYRGDGFAGEFRRVRKRDRRKAKNQRDAGRTALRRADKSREAKHDDAQRRDQQAGREHGGQVSDKGPVKRLVRRAQRQQRGSENHPRNQRRIGRAGRLDGINMAVEGDDVGGVEAAKIVDPQNAFLDYRAHQVEAARHALVGALIKVGVGDERDQEDRSLDLAAAILRGDRTRRVRGGPLHRLLERPDVAARNVLKMRKSSSPNMRQPAHAIAASATNVNASEIGEPIGAGAACCRIAFKS